MELVEEIYSEIARGQIGLFVGAGISKLSGGPLSSDLIDIIDHHFEKNHEGGFEKICQDIVRENQGNRKKLENLIYENLINLKPNRVHNIISWYDWQGIYTTNYDELIEDAYKEKDRLKPLDVITNPIDSINRENKNKVRLYKLAGTIRPTDDKSKMLITTSDHTLNFHQRHYIFSQLMSSISDSHFLFIGYSFNDEIILMILDFLATIVEPSKFPKSYAIFRSARSTEFTQNLKRYNIESIVMDTNEFFENLIIKFRPEEIRKKFALQVPHLLINNKLIKIPYNFITEIEPYSAILNEISINNPPGSITSFFKGNINNWGAYHNNFDFQRDFCVNHEKFDVDKLLSEIEKLVEINENPYTYIKIEGPGGSGKSVLLNRILFDSYRKNNWPCIIVKYEKIRYYTNSELVKVVNQVGLLLKDIVHKPIIILSLDNASFYFKRLRGLLYQAWDNQYRIVIIASERTNLWEKYENTSNFVRPDFTVHLSHTMDEEEAQKFIKFLIDCGYHEYSSIPTQTVIEGFANSFFVYMYQLVRDAQKPLVNILSDQYEEVSEQLQSILQYTAIIHSFGISAPKSILYLVCNVELEKLDNLLEIDGRDILYIEEMEDGTNFLKYHHRLIAELSVEELVPPEIRFTKLVDIVNYALYAQIDQLELIEILLITVLGPKGFGSELFNLPYKQVYTLFKTAADKGGSRAIYHHWAILISDHGNYDHAIEILNIALNKPKIRKNKRGFEEDANILNSLGTVRMKKAIKFVKKGNIGEAREIRSRAINNLNHAAIKNRKMDLASYFTHIHWGCIKFAEVLKDRDYANRILMEGLEICEIASGVATDEELQNIENFYLTIQTLLSDNIGDIENLLIYARKMEDQYNDPSGYYAIISKMVGINTKNWDLLTNDEKGLVKQHLDKIINSYPNKDLFIAIDLLIKLQEDKDWMENKLLIQRFEKWYYHKSRKSNFQLEYMFGIYLFSLGAYKAANYVFNMLKSHGCNRGKFEHYTMTINVDSDNLFQGKIWSIVGKSGGQIEINNQTEDYSVYTDEDLSTFKRRDEVIFDMKFNKWGPIAIDVCLKGQ